MTFGNLGRALDIVAEIRADEVSLIQGERQLTWAQVGRRANNIAAWMVECGASRQGKVGIYTYNDPAYLESIYAAFKASLVPVNVNYRYQAKELRYLLENADAEIVVVHEEFAPLLAEVLPDLPKIVGVLVVEEGGNFDITSMPNGAPYGASAGTDRPAAATKPSPHVLRVI